MNPSTCCADVVQALPHEHGAVAVIVCALGTDRTGLAATTPNPLTAAASMLLACINRAASAYTLMVQETAFGVDTAIASDSAFIAIFSAQHGMSGKDQFIAGGWTSGRIGQPMMKAAAAAFECVLQAEHVYGTHRFFIGRIDTVLQGELSRALLYVDVGCGATHMRPRTLSMRPCNNLKYSRICVEQKDESERSFA